ncbi:MAG: response regulator [Acidobacteria bacterium]|nr:response regulator [Acidobacteriota bacterium]
MKTNSRKEPIQTILVVGDDEAVLKTVVAILEHANFRVLSADSSEGALKLAGETGGKIHMLLSAVDMPQMSGPDLGETLKKNQARHTRYVDVGWNKWKSTGAQLRLGLYSEGICSDEAG